MDAARELASVLAARRERLERLCRLAAEAGL
jgi:hypothetical protein